MLSNNRIEAQAVAELAPEELATAEARSRDRNRRALLTSSSSAVAKGLSALTGLVSVPLALHYLGAERYGLWMTISSVVMFLNFSDLGINNGLLNGIAKAHSAHDRDLAKQYVSSAFFFLTGVALLLGSTFAVAYHWIPFQTIFNVKSAQAVADAGPAVAAFVFCFLVGIPSGIVSRIELGYQDGFAANLWSSIGSVLSLGAVLLAIQLRCSLAVLVFAMGAAPIFSALLNSIFLFCFKRPWLFPSRGNVRWEVSKELLHSGGTFFLLQVAMAVGFFSDNIVLAQVMGPKAVAEYSVPAKLFNLIAVAVSFVSMSLWPAYREALMRRDYRWVGVTLRRSLLGLFTLAIIIAGVLFGLGPRIIQLWVGHAVPVSRLLLFALATLNILLALTTPISIFLNSASVVRFQLIVSCAASLANITCSIWLTKNIGVSGVVFGSLISQVLTLVPYGFYLRSYFSKLTAVASPQGHLVHA